ncbi:MAG: flagellar basal body P-ring formation chaperone FlgA [Aquificaceae bacterium]
MWLLSLFLLINLCFAEVEKLVEEEIYKRFGDLIKVNRVRIVGKVEKVDKIELDMEYGKSRTIAYIHSGDERYQAFIDVLWKVKVFVAKEDIEKGAFIKEELFRVEERFMKSVPSDLRLNPEEFENFIASTRIVKGTMLRRSLLKEIPAVKAGEPVEAVFKSGAIEVAFQAIAVDTGSIGKVIRIKRDDGRVLRGKVVSRGRVEVVP